MLTETAFYTLYDKLAARLVNWLVANGTEYGIACDIVQETFLRLWQNRTAFGDGQVPNSWLFTTASRLRTDHWRKARRCELHEDMGAVVDSDGKLLTAPEDEKSILLRECLVKALAALPEDQRTAYTLFQIGGSSIREIAAMTNVTENLVKVRIHRARQKLQTLLADL